MAAHTGISKSTVARYFALFGLQPHRSKSGEQSCGNTQGDADSNADEDVAQWKFRTSDREFL